MRFKPHFYSSSNFRLDNSEITNLYRNVCISGFLYFLSISITRLIYNDLILGAIIFFIIGLGFAFIALLFPSKRFKFINNPNLFYLLSFIGFNFSFLLEGGFLNPSVYLIFPLMLIIIYLTNKKTTNIIILLILINYTILYTVNYYHPSISEFSNSFILKAERVISHLFALFFTIAIVNTIFKSYKEDKQKAITSEKAKEAFLANMSHQIRTPLNGINGYSELLLDDDIPEFEKEAFKNRILTNAKELHHMIFNLIDLAIIQEKSLKLKEDKILIREIVNSLQLKSQEELEHQNKKLNIDFKIDKPLDNLRLKFNGDRLIQLVWNFIENSIYHSNSGSITITFTIESVLEKLYIIVDDQGEGIEKTLLKNIINQNILDRNQSNIANPKPGMGIPISRGIIEYFGGKIDITSEKNIGTHVVVEIPLDKKYEIIN